MIGHIPRSFCAFRGGEADEWLDKTVSVRNVSSFSLPECMAELERLKKVNGEIMGGKGGKQGPKRKPKASAVNTGETKTR